MEYMVTKSKEVIEAVGTFSKEQLLGSKRYSDQKDIINVLLTNEKDYSFEEVDQAIDKFMKGKVK